MHTCTYTHTQDVEALIGVVTAQDAAGPFRRLVGSTATKGARLKGRSQVPSGAMGLKRQEEDSQVCVSLCVCVSACASF